MCGIVAFFSRKDEVSPSVVQTATRRLRHRGPDGQKHWISPDGRVAQVLWQGILLRQLRGFGGCTAMFFGYADDMDRAITTSQKTKTESFGLLRQRFLPTSAISSCWRLPSDYL